MEKWYYVDGTERMGPVSLDVLTTLFKEQKIGPETYVWKKGFANWERIKNIDGLNLNENDFKFIENEDLSIEDANAIFNELSDLKKTEVEHSNHSTTNEDFNWDNMDLDRSLFFLKIGELAHKSFAKIWGPYSANQMIEAFYTKRINHNTYVFALGFDRWVGITKLPFFNKKLQFEGNSSEEESNLPIYFLYEEHDKKYAMMVKKTNKKNKIVVQSSYGFIADTKIKVNLYHGNELIQSNINMSVISFDTFEQIATVNLESLNSNSQKIIKEINA